MPSAKNCDNEIPSPLHTLSKVWMVGVWLLRYHVEIVDCVPVEEVVDSLTPKEKVLGDYSPGRWAWVLKNPVMFDMPIYARGKQGWWEWDEGLPEWKRFLKNRFERTEKL